MFVVKFDYGRAIEDYQKSVLPTIIFVNRNHYTFGDLRCKGFGISIGWWDYYIIMVAQFSLTERSKKKLERNLLILKTRP